MDVLDPVFPGALLEQIDQHQNLVNNVFGPKCSSKCASISDISVSKLLEKPVHKVSPGFKDKKSLKQSGSCQEAPDDIHGLSRPFGLHASGVSTASSLADSANIDKPVTKITKKKNKKKRKSYKKLLADVVVETEPSECGHDIAVAPYHSSKEEMEDVKGYKIQTSNYTELDWEKSKNMSLSSAVTASSCASEHGDTFLKDASDCDSKLLSECSSSGSSDFPGNNMFSDVWNSDCVIDICERVSNGILQSAEDLNTMENKSISECTLNKECKHDKMTSHSDIINKRGHHPNLQTGKENSQLIWQKIHKNNRNACTHGIKRSNHVYVQKDVRLPEEILLLKHNPCPSDELLQPSVYSSAGHNGDTHRVKNFAQNAQGMYGGTHGNVLVGSSQCVAKQRIQGDLSQHVSLSWQADTLGNKESARLKEKMNQSFKNENANNSKKGPRGHKESRLRSKTVFCRKEALEVQGKLHHYNKSAASKRSIHNNQCYGINKLASMHPYPASAYVEVNVPCTMISGASERALLDGVHPCASVRIPGMGNVFVGTDPASSNREEANSACVENELSCEDGIKHDIISRVSLQKWIPVGRKDSGTLNIGPFSASEDLKVTQSVCQENANIHPEEYNISPYEPVSPLGPSKTCLASSHETTKLMATEDETPPIENLSKNMNEKHGEEGSKDCVTPNTKPKDSTPLYISEMAVEALNDAYRLQMASENFEFATGSPLAEFERLLYSATPVIASSFAPQHCDVCSMNQLSGSSLCKHQIPNIPLGAVWSWYEKPGNYGLEVKAEDSQKQKGSDSDTVLFHAHFVPFLSAIQLFGHLNLSTSSRGCSTAHLTSDISCSGQAQSNPSLSKMDTDLPCQEAVNPYSFCLEETIISKLLNPLDDSEDSYFSQSGGSDTSGSSEPADTNNIELIFEFFEYEQPQQRKSLYDKIMELIKAGTSNNKVFGDPSKLECMNLQDLHPASWYSVAWYPIYRIPAGNFRASFLTYHSLGHLVQRCSSKDSLDDKTFCVASPVLGLQSYNAQGECWFYPKKHVESSFKEFMPFNGSEILKERLRTLEKTAFLFARGCVFKDNVEVTNRQPDYEFFLSRKR
ncbi:PREDICTED: uncharacterized protein LOC104590823 isoform X2 [Nelumbo nucifera]|uniref:Uncharacterized protein LOC104590823 isoform X2 n=1 Tax=Nelumbo nucifera TaxID=4432 RepID=A0A1U7ZI21_NELNU|nr:PREDICTED: uncharacterized protein LOC104590823 isoform X2 [Nelumbo nucifera]